MGGKLISIGALSQATGFPSETIRTWERRYSFPRPKRSRGGHRLYDFALIEHLLLIRAALDQGHRPSSVTGIKFKDLQALLKPVDVMQAPDPETVSHGTDPWIASCLEATRNMETVNMQMLLRSSLATLGLQGFVVGRCALLLETIGHEWSRGNLSIAQEHFAASALESILAEQWRSIANANRGPLCILATLKGEQHTLGLHMAACLMAVRGVRIIWLGANMPTNDLCDTSSILKPDYVCLSFSRSYNKQEAVRLLKPLRAKLASRITLLIGGAGAPPVNPELAVRIRGLDDLATRFGTLR